MEWEVLRDEARHEVARLAVTAGLGAGKPPGYTVGPAEVAALCHLQSEHYLRYRLRRQQRRA